MILNSILVRTPKELNKAIENKFEDNELFIDRINKLSEDFFDIDFNSSIKEIESKIDCLQCANCCSFFHLPLPEIEVTRLAHLKNESIIAFKEKYTEIDFSTKTTFLKLNHCVFLESNKCCSIYSKRPQACRNYPYPQVNGIKKNIRKILNNYTVCPIIYNVIENLKCKY